MSVSVRICKFKKLPNVRSSLAIPLHNFDKMNGPLAVSI